MKFRTLALLLVMASVPSALAAQKATAVVRGVVFTPYEYSEAVVPLVRIAFRAGDMQREVVTDAQGRYEIRLPEAVYSISGGRAGFCPINRTGLDIRAAAETLINVRLLACSLADGAEVGRDGKVIRELAWETSPLKSESVVVKLAGGLERRIFLEFAARTVSGQRTEYRGTMVRRDNVPAAMFLGARAVYADSLVLDKKTGIVTAAGHVTIENGKFRETPADRASAVRVPLKSEEIKP